MISKYWGYKKSTLTILPTAWGERKYMTECITLLIKP